MPLTIPREEYMEQGHTACAGCGAALSMRYMLKAAGPKTALAIPACCWSVVPGEFPATNLKVPLLYTPFAAAGAAISGLREGLDAQGKEDYNVFAFAGDGGTADIGLQGLSAAMERGHNVIYIMYDNEAYMNTGIQRSGSTPYGAWTTTTPVGLKRDFKRQKKEVCSGPHDSTKCSLRRYGYDWVPGRPGEKDIDSQVDQGPKVHSDSLAMSTGMVSQFVRYREDLQTCR